MFRSDNAASNCLLEKYDVPSPRYTSYPTVPFWDNRELEQERWLQHVKQAFHKTNTSEGISLYLHLPFCEQLCTYCGCNKRITVNHKVEEPYLEALLQEWQQYLAVFEEKPRITELHLGGGTPTFFSAANLKYLLEKLLKDAEVPANAQFSVEVHPNYTTVEQLQVLYEAGFRRLSVGVQDFDLRVQFVINRIQTFEQTKEVFDIARAIGYTSINADIIYGLPLQTTDSIQHTIACVKELRPERIAFYSYAHVPWKSKSQRRYSDADLPAPFLKRALYEFGRNLLQEAGYVEVGLDHFSLPEDELYMAAQHGSLHRNFMGYTSHHTELLIGLGASSISDTGTAFMQNQKEVEAYEEAVQRGKLPLMKGHELTSEDILLRRHIKNLMCQFSTSWEADELPYLVDALVRLQPLAEDKLVDYSTQHIEVLPTGKPFVRNIAMCLDARLWDSQPTTPVFSRSV
ncbi:oxygen-independent coproporphyrinogen III oxidase [Pontibacter sp. SGAir0037]|uniref:oxygen-independent coproporphyrinogen III oxidase n=1 Tax=Pontibacter sp. SGAir0037 TaxID=2571030 RepID=UPI0010CD52C6|nr:oxygen-independent coproporphyrinogen III oxidase [Pontibacter sp. SGAir0037]QCR23127.1 oxygen-independent coproporphyrinogen III oxidase [Pontibacter sp. SGAir0037]